MSYSMEKVDDLLGSGTEEAVYNKAFKQGYNEGTQEGSKEGWRVGLKTGTDIGSELGKFKGFAVAVQEDLLCSTVRTEEVGGESATHTKTLKLCEKIIKLVDEFNWNNITSVHDATAQVRTQFHLLKTQVGVTDDRKAENIPGQKFSF